MAMKKDRIRGNTIYWTFRDGPTAGMKFEHVFLKSGAVKYGMADGAKNGKMTREKKYEVANISPDVDAVSYLGSSGYTLTVVMDFRTGRAVGFASNAKELVLQHGTFEVAGTARKARKRGKR